MSDVLAAFQQELASERVDVLPAEAAVQVCVKAVANAMGTAVASLYGFDPDRGELPLIATRGLAHSAIGFVALKLGEGATGRAAQGRCPLAIEDVTRDPLFTLIPGFDQSGFRSILAVPILDGDRLVGALNIQSVDRHRYTGTEIATLEALAGALAPLLSGWHADGNLSRQLRGPRLLSYVDGMVAASQGPAEICERLADDLSTVLSHVVCQVRLVTDEADPIAVGRDVELPTEVLVVDLRGETRLCGHLTLQYTGSGVAPWHNPAAQRYVASVTEQFGIALERVLAARGRRETAAEQEAQDDLISFVLGDRGLDALVAEVSRLAGGAVAILDPFGSTLAGTVPESGGVERPILAGDQQLGSLVGPEESAVLSAAAQVVALELTKWRVGFEVETRLRGDLLDLLLEGTQANARDVIPRASLSGLDLRRAYTPVMFAITLSGGRSQEPMALRSMVDLVQRRLGPPPAALVFARTEGLLALVDASTEALTERVETLRTDLSRLAGTPSVGLGLGTPSIWPDTFARAVRTTVRAAEVAKRMGSTRALSGERLGCYVLLVTMDHEALQDYVRDQIGVLLDQDERSGGDLVATLEAYFAAGDRLKPAAEALFIHVNTLKYRIARIDALTDSALSDPGRKHNLYLALHALRVLDSERKSLLQDNFS